MICGVDEAGRGCLAGPVFAAAVIFPPHFHHPHIKDSKQLNELERERLVPIIQQQALAWAVAKATTKEIDQYNILRATFLAMHRAIKALCVCPTMIEVDGNRFEAYPFINHRCIIKGDQQCLHIAAASILAKTTRDRAMQRLNTQFPQYDWLQNKGYPTAMHRQKIQQFGRSDEHRQSFKLLKENE